MNELPLGALRAFAALHRTGGIRPAARLLGVAHSAVARHVKELEAWVAVPLVRREPGSRLLELTPQGDRLGRVAADSLSSIAAAVAELKESRAGNAVVIATTPSVAARWLLPRLPALRQRAPWIELSVVVDQRTRPLGDQGADLALRMGRGRWTDHPCEPLMEDSLVPVVSRDLWERAGRPTDPAWLVSVPLIHDRDPLASWAAWKARHGPAGLNARAGARLASSDLVIRAAALGQGAALCFERLMAEDLRSALLVQPFGDLRLDLGPVYWLVRPAGGAPRSATEEVVAWLRDESGRSDAVREGAGTASPLKSRSSPAGVPSLPAPE